MNALLRTIVLAYLASATFAQSPTVMVRLGDQVQGAGRVTDIGAFEVDPFGNWSTLVKTDDPLAHTVLLSLYGPSVKTGDVSPPLGGATLASIESPTWDWFRIPAYITRLQGGTARQAVMHGNGVQFYTGESATTYTSQLPTGATWQHFDSTRLSFANSAYLLQGAINVPAGGLQPEDVLAVVWHGGSFGVLSHMDIIARENTLAPGLQRTIEGLRTGAGQSSQGRNGQRVLWSCYLSGTPNDDSCVYLSNIFAPGQGVLVAREGSPSPVAGRSWGPLQDHAVDVNANGWWTLRGRLDGSDTATDEVLVLNGTVLAREGSPVPATAPYPLVSLGEGRGILDEAGAVLWYGRWDDPSTPGEDEALFQNQTPLVRTGATLVEGQLLVDIESTAHSYTVDHVDGRMLAFVGSLADGTRCLILLDGNDVSTYCLAKENSAGCTPAITWTGQAPSISAGSGFNLTVKRLLPNQPAVFFYGTSGSLALPLHAGRLCVNPPLRRLPLQMTGGSSSSCSGQVTVDFNAWLATGTDPTLVAGQRINLQLWFRDPGFAAPDDVGLSNGLEFLIGP